MKFFEGSAVSAEVVNLSVDAHPAHRLCGKDNQIPATPRHPDRQNKQHLFAAELAASG